MAASSSWFTPAPPRVAIEIAKRRVTVVALEGAGQSHVIEAYASEPLPDGAITPALVGANVADAAGVTAVLKRALDRAGLASTSRAALIVPDSVARVSLLPFDHLPPRPAELEELIRWQVRKATPYPIADAAVGHTIAHMADGKTIVAAIIARRDVLAQYEALVAAAGIHPGIVDLASLNVMNAVMGAAEAPAGDWLLVHLASDATTLAVLRGQDLMFHRHRPAADQEPLGALVHQTAMYHEDRLGGGKFSHVWICGAAGAADAARAEIAERLGVGAEAVDVRPVAAFRESVPVTGEVLDALAAPVGVLLRERKAAA